MKTNYSGSRCPKCQGSYFELAEETPEKSVYKIFFVRCSSCLTIVGNIDYFNSGHFLHKIMDKLGIDY